jgi:hypothetical protein
MFSDDDLQYERDYIEHLKSAALLAGVQGKHQLSKDIRREKHQREQILQDMIEVNEGIEAGTWVVYAPTGPFSDAAPSDEYPIAEEEISRDILDYIDKRRKVKP